MDPITFSVTKRLINNPSDRTKFMQNPSAYLAKQGVPSDSFLHIADLSDAKSQMETNVKNLPNAYEPQGKRVPKFGAALIAYAAASRAAAKKAEDC